LVIRRRGRGSHLCKGGFEKKGEVKLGAIIEEEVNQNKGMRKMWMRMRKKSKGGLSVLGRGH